MGREIGSDEAAALLHAAGLRTTQPRLTVLRLLSGLTAPVSHAEMVGKLTNRDFDEATIYRCLNDLADAGIFTRLELGDRTYRFEMAPHAAGDGTTSSRHPHFLCTGCGRITCLEHRDVFHPDELRRIATFVGEVTEVLLKGICHQCGG